MTYEMACEYIMPLRASEWSPSLPPDKLVSRLVFTLVLWVSEHSLALLDGGLATHTIKRAFILRSGGIIYLCESRRSI